MLLLSVYGLMAITVAQIVQRRMIRLISNSSKRIQKKLDVAQIEEGLSTTPFAWKE